MLHICVGDDLYKYDHVKCSSIIDTVVSYFQTMYMK